jgi:hypothetical protein
MAANAESSVIGIAMAAIDGRLMLDPGERPAPRPFSGCTPTNPIYA